jgi:hypothetical protein
MRLKSLALLAFFALPAFAQFPYGPAPEPAPQSTVAFQARAKTSILSASTASASVALAAITNTLIPQIEVYNSTTGIAHVVFCAQAAACTASVGSPGTATADYPVAPGSVIVMTPPAGAGVAAVILESSSGVVEFTPGVGL